MLNDQPEFLIVTGQSGAGKSTAINCLEDIGYFCIDNFPPNLITKLAELCLHSEGKINKVALVIDIRGRDFFANAAAAIDDLGKMGINCSILFLQASDEVLVRRFKETRRRHPLAPGGNIVEGIDKERLLLQEFKGMSNKIIDTSALSGRTLKEEIIHNFLGLERQRHMLVSIVSFGYKYGVPLDADLIFDVRFLPNPFYVPELRPLTGEEKSVRDYALENEIGREFMTKLLDMLEFLVGPYAQEGKTHLKIAIGCTGGKHRSVAVAQEIYLKLGQSGSYEVLIEHRDKDIQICEE